MAYQLSDIAQKVLLRVRDTGYSTNEVWNYINDTLNDIYNEYRLPFMRTSQTYTTTANVSDITNSSALPTNLVQTIDVINTTAGQESVIPYKDTGLLDDYYPDEDDVTAHPAGQPQYWYYDDDTIRLFPKPDKAYTLKLRYWQRPTLLTTANAVPDLPQEFEELLVMGASYRILQVKDNYDQAGILQNKYDEILDKLVARYAVPQAGSPHRMRINRGPGRSRAIDSYRRI